MPAQILDTPVPVAACPVSRAGGSRLSPRGSRKTTSCLRRAPAHLPAALRCARARPLALAAATLHPTLIGRCARSPPDCPDAWNSIATAALLRFHRSRSETGADPVLADAWSSSNVATGAHARSGREQQRLGRRGKDRGRSSEADASVTPRC